MHGARDDEPSTMGDGKRFDQALRALDKLLTEQEQSDHAAQPPLNPPAAPPAAPARSRD